MPAVATSGATLHSRSRDQIITRALRIIGAIGQGETAGANAITEGAEALNAITKELITDGMPLWKIKTYTAFAYTATQTYLIGTGSTVNQVAPMKILQAWNRDTSVTPNRDTPMLLVTQQDYNWIGSKTTTGTPQQMRYNPPGANIITVSDMVGTITVFPSPDANAIANLTCVIEAVKTFEDFAASSDVPDMPSYWFNALVWFLASELSYEYGVSLPERGMIQKRADMHRAAALSYGTEEGSILLRPRAEYGSPGGSSY